MGLIRWAALSASALAFAMSASACFPGWENTEVGEIGDASLGDGGRGLDGSVDDARLADAAADAGDARASEASNAGDGEIGAADASGGDASLDQSSPGTGEGGVPDASADAANGGDASKSGSDASADASDGSVGTSDASSVDGDIVEAGLTDGSTCEAGQTACGTTCIDTSTDPNNCGTCAHSCGHSAVGAGGCSGSTCTAFTLASASASPPLLIDPTRGALYATGRDGTSAVIADTTSGGVTTVQAGYTGTVLAQDPYSIYMGVAYASTSSGVAEILSIGKIAPNSISTLSSSQQTYSNYSWIGYVPGSATPLCARWTGSPSAGTGWTDLECGTADGNLTANLISCTANNSLSCFVCDGTNWSSTTCGPPPPKAIAADSAGVVWLDGYDINVVPADDLTSVPTMYPVASTNPGPIVLDSGYAYYCDTTSFTLYRSSRTASGTTTMQQLTSCPTELAVDTQYVYWGDSSSNWILRLPTNATTSVSPTTLASGTSVSSPTGIAVDTSAVYWINGDGSVGKRVF